MKEKPIRIIVENYKNKNRTFVLPSNSSISIYKEEENKAGCQFITYLEIDVNCKAGIEENK